MSFPSDQNLLRSLIEAVAGSQSESYTVPASPYQHKLGAALSPAMPAGWNLAVVGAAPISAPAAPTAGSPATTTAAGHFLAADGTKVWQWKLLAATQYGFTTLSSAYAPGALANGVTGANIHLPAITVGTADAPVLYRRLYRTAAGGSTFYWVADIDNSTTDYMDGKPDTDLEEVAPSANTSGSTGAVTMTINGAAATEVASTATPTAGQFKVDYSRNSGTAGTITHAAADVGLPVVATYIAANLLTMALLNNIITGIKSLVTAVGAASGIAATDSAGRVTGAGAFLSVGTTGYARLWDGNALHPSIWLQPGQGFASITNNAFWNGSAWTYELNGGASLLQINGSTLTLYHAASGTASAVITWTQAASFSNSAITLYLATTINALLTANGLVTTGNAQIGGALSAASSYLGTALTSGALSNPSGGAMGSGATAALTVGATQHRGLITITSGTSGLGTGLAITVTFPTPFTVVPAVHVQQLAGAPNDTNARPYNVSVNGFSIFLLTAPSTIGSNYQFSYTAL